MLMVLMVPLTSLAIGLAGVAPAHGSLRPSTSGIDSRRPVAAGGASAPAGAGEVMPLATTTGTDDRWILPASGPLGALFRPPAVRWGPGHRGVDIAAGVGATVMAPRDGVIAFVGVVVDRGVVTINHPGGLRSSLEPVVSTLGVGDAVSRGDDVGVVTAERAHCAGCLHWGVRRGAVYVDPLDLLGREPVGLLPSGLRPGRPLEGMCAAGASRPCASVRSGTP